MRRAVAPLALLLASACTHYPESYPPPMQRTPIADQTAFGYRSFLEMNTPVAESFFVKDIRALEGNSWRWTGPNPTMRYVLPKVDGLKFAMDYALPGVTMKETGPVTMSVRINGRLLDRWSYEKSGEYHFEKSVEEAWLERNADNIVAIEIDPVWKASNGVQLGFILTRAGFIE